MVGPAHPGEFRGGHMAGDARVPRPVSLVARVLRWIANPVFVARHARLIGLFVVLELVPTARCMAMQTVQPA